MTAASVVASAFGGGSHHYASSAYNLALNNDDDLSKCDTSKKFLLDLDENNNNNNDNNQIYHQLNSINNSSIHDLTDEYGDMQKKTHSIKRQKLVNIVLNHQLSNTKDLFNERPGLQKNTHV